jgi:hypothetical protein
VSKLGTLPRSSWSTLGCSTAENPHGVSGLGTPSRITQVGGRRPYDLIMPPSSRHGRQPTFTKPIATVFWLVAVGVVAVALLAEQRLAMQLAIAGALSASFMIWSVYDSALREARADYGHERTLHARSVGAAADEIRARDHEVARLGAQVERLERELAQATATIAARDDVPDLWSDLADAPTIVDFANRREARPIAIVKTTDQTSPQRAAETA